MPPAHWNCRSTTIPIIKPEFDMGAKIKGKRPSIGGTGVKQVSSRTTYGGWLKKQPTAFVDEALGVERSKLFRAGKFKIDAFTDPTGRVYTLLQLQKMNPIAFIEGGVATVVTKIKPIFKPKPKSILPPKTIKMQSKSQVKKQFDSDLAGANKDPRYVLASDGLPKTRFRPTKRQRGKTNEDIQRAKFGKSNIATLTDESASALYATTTEANLIASRYGVQPLRAVKTGTSRGAAASMGDGVLSVDKQYFNSRAASLNKAGSAEKAKKLQTKLDDINTDLTTMRGELDALARESRYSPEYRSLAKEYNKKVNSYNRYAKQIAEVQPRSFAGDRQISAWSVGDDLGERPFTTGSFFKDDLDDLRSTVYHEMGHHIHQQYNVTSAAEYLDPPLERVLHKLYTNKRTITPSKYAGTNHKEWFAENFSLHHMGRTDLVDPVITDMLASMENGTFKEFLENLQ